mmetsp:Transcript_12797/g.47283  ORF Transcript_12797/g.47283 Transcript_12797/m.47283 type:complete len:108 (-) Transcript_12797:2171-2494(-)
MAAEQGTEDLPFQCDIDVVFPTERAAKMVEQAIKVDKELQPDKIRRDIRAEQMVLKVRFQATEARLLRVSLSSFYDMVGVCLRTLQEFDDAVADGRVRVVKDASNGS